MSTALNPAPPAPTSKREGGVELLRIVLMCFIISHHVMVHGAGLFDPNAMTTFSWVRLFLNSFFVIAVDSFILISGFYGIRLKSASILKLVLQALTFSILLGFGFALSGRATIDANFWQMTLMPISSNLWWFLTNYFFLLLISPILNRLAQELDKRPLSLLVGGFFTLECLVGFFLAPANMWGYSGYTLMNFTFLYLLGAWLKRFHTIRGRGFYVTLYLSTSLLIFAVAFTLVTTGNPGFVFSRAFGYNSPLLIVSAVAIFFVFKSLKVQAGWIFAGSPLVLGIYFLHDHPYIRSVLYSQVLHVRDWANTPWFFVFWPLSVLGIFGVGAAIEALRVKLTAPLETKLSGLPFFQAADKVFKALSGR